MLRGNKKESFSYNGFISGESVLSGTRHSPRPIMNRILCYRKLADTTML